MPPRRLRVDELLYASVADRNTPMQIALLGMALASAGGLLYWRERSKE